MFMNLSCGIVGLPNVGKSTLFNALLKKQAALAANYPFATVEPNIGIVPVPDDRLNKLAKVIKVSEGLEVLPPLRPATIKFVDIAGLVKGAAKGEGLGNKFLAHVREVDLIINLLRDFEDKEIIKEGGINPKTDYEIVTEELILKDLETVEKTKNVKVNKVKTQEDKKRQEVLEKLYQGLNKGKKARDILLSSELEIVRDLCLLTAKEEIKVFNVGERDERLKERTSKRNRLIICAKMEEDLAGFSEEERQEYLQTAQIKETGLEKFIRVAYEKLNLISFLTAGVIEVRAWTITKGIKAPQAAAVIHTDFEKKFIKVKICNYNDFIDFGGWKKCAEKGKVRFEGKDYEMMKNDVVEFMIGN